MPSARRAVAQASAGGAQNISEKQFLSHPTFSVRFASIRQALTKSKIFELRERRTHVIYRNESDETLVMLTLAGEQSAYETLVVRHQRAVMASAVSVTHNQHMAEDASQDAFVTAWMKLDTLQDGRKFSAWVCRIAKNCALNMVRRFRSYLPFEALENMAFDDEQRQNPAELYALAEERDELNESIGKLPQKVGEIIRLHYFEGLSIAEIAGRMRISEGTVKWQLHDGRKRIRKGLCAMNEKYNDTLVQRVMKKVAELRLWQFKNDKSGFEAVYRDVLREVEELPESRDKSHALADVLLCGWWWLPGEKNDTLLKRIADAAIEGKNEEAMTFIVIKEDSRFWGSAKIDFMRSEQIPRLEQAGFRQTLGREYFWLGYYAFREGRTEEGEQAYGKVREILTEADAYYHMVPYARRMEEALSAAYKDKHAYSYRIGTASYEFRYADGALRFWKDDMVEEGALESIDFESSYVFRNAAICDGRFFADLKPGGSFTASDGSTLTFEADNETVHTPAGTFTGCQLWVAVHTSWRHKSVFKTYYKDGVGIVRQEHIADGIGDVRLLSSYHIAGGRGLLPMARGNRWEYAAAYPASVIRTELLYEVSFADETRVLLTSFADTERMRYDENAWADMVQQIANDYFDPNTGKVCDVTHAVERAELLAKTPVEKAHSKAAASVARRIMATDPEYNPQHTASGHWNFFERRMVCEKNGAVCLSGYDSRWSFELKDIDDRGPSESSLLFNDILGILQDAAKCIWSEEWRIGASPIVEYDWNDCVVKTQLLCEDGGTVATKAGIFEHCLRLTMEISGFIDGWAYRAGKKVYYFADGVGIVRTENEYRGQTTVYELTSYTGEGEGYMPLADGMLRRYDALDLADGFVGAAEYSYVADENGDIVIFADRTGIRVLPPPVTRYGAIQGEEAECRLWEQGKWKETHLKHSENNFHIMLHFLARPGWHAYDSSRSIGICAHHMALMESFGGKDGVPPAWNGVYGWHALVKASAYFVKGEKEEGYRCLELACRHYEKHCAARDGDLLQLGSAELFGDIRYVKGRETLLLPDGAGAPVSYGYRLDPDAANLYHCISAWGWFDSVRNEERFKAYVDRARKLAVAGR